MRVEQGKITRELTLREKGKKATWQKKERQGEAKGGEIQRDS